LHKIDICRQVGHKEFVLPNSALFALGLNYRTAPIEIRERVSFPAALQRDALESFRTATAADEATLVSTCNRTELYMRASHGDVLDRASDWITTLPSVIGLDIYPHLYRLTGSEVARHAFRVASGLDSMILGEPQVLGQVKHAVKIASDAQALSGPLDRLFQETFQVAKTVRSQTEIGTTSVSMAAAAAKLAIQLFGDMRECRVLLIGTGEMIQLAATHFLALNPKQVVVANRTLAKAEALADQFGAASMTLEQVPLRIHEFDVIITSTASTLPLIGKGMIERALKQRRRKPMFLVDLAVPRDIEPEVSQLEDAYLHTLDSLGRIIEQNLGRRQAAIVEADAIIEEHTQRFMHWMEVRKSVPLIQQLRAKADQYRSDEVLRAQRLLLNGEDPAKVLEILSQSLTNKLLHHPLKALKDSGGDQRKTPAEVVREMYHLEPPH
jgi:glutamyl-tRNA reductase